MALIGYARVSSVGQTLDVQLDKLKHCDKVFQEKKSGASSKRPRLKACLEYVREGDTLVVTRLDRLARSTLHLCQIAAELERKKVGLQVLDQNIDTTDATGRLLFNMLGAIAQFETEIRAERQMDGIRKAKERGVKFGKKKEVIARASRRAAKKTSSGRTHQDAHGGLRTLESKCISLPERDFPSLSRIAVFLFLHPFTEIAISLCFA